MIRILYGPPRPEPSPLPGPGPFPAGVPEWEQDAAQAAAHAIAIKVGAYKATALSTPDEEVAAEEVAAACAAALADEGGATSALLPALAARVAQWLPRLRQAARPWEGMPARGAASPALEAPGGGLLVATAGAAGLLRTLGPEGEQEAERLESEGRERWAEYLDAKEALEAPDALAENPDRAARLAGLAGWQPYRAGACPDSLVPIPEGWIWAMLAGQGIVLAQFALWAPFMRHGPSAPPVVQALARALLPKVREEAFTPPRPALEIVERGGLSFGKLPRVGASVSWAAGGNFREVDGKQWGATPGAQARYFVPVGWQPEQQSSLPLGLEPEEPVPPAVALATLTTLRKGRGGELVSPTIGKTLLFMLATGRGRLVGLPLRDLARTVYPEGTRLETAKHLAEVNRALWLAKMAAVCLPRGELVPLFEVAPVAGTPPDPQAVPSWKVSARMELEMAKGGALAGEILLCWDLLLGLGTRQGPELRAYVHAAAGWNAARLPVKGKQQGKLDPGRLPRLSLAAWGRRINSLPEAALATGQRSHEAKQAAVGRLKQALETLEALGALRLEGRLGGVRSEIRLLPPADLEGAYEAFRAGAAQKREK